MYGIDMRKILIGLSALLMSVVGVAGSRQIVEADAIHKASCGWEASGSYAAAFCPTRWQYQGPQYFRIRMQCKMVGSQNTTVVYGPWRQGGNWIGSSRSCQAPYSSRVYGQTWIEYL